MPVGYVNLSEAIDKERQKKRSHRSPPYRTQAEADWAAERSYRGSGGSFYRVGMVEIDLPEGHAFW